MLKIQRFTVNPFAENCYVVSDDTGDAVVIDCGALYSEERHALLDYIADNRLTPKHLIATHGHVDHNFGNDTIFDAYGLKPRVHAADAPLMGHLAEQALAFCQLKLDANMPPLGEQLAEGSDVCFGNHRLTIIHTPGHTPGSVVVACPEERVAFTGDTLFAMSIGRTDLGGGSFGDLMASLGKLKTALPKDTTLLPGHGQQSTMEEELKHNPYLARLQ